MAPNKTSRKLSALAAEDAGWGYFLCTYKEFRTGRSGSEFVFLSLQDASGQVVAKLMTDVDRYKNEFEAGEFVRVEGRGSIYNGQVQLCCRRSAASIPTRIACKAFAKRIASSARRARSTRCGRSCKAHLRSVKNDHIRVLLNRVVADNESQLRIWPAAQQIHHAYRGGFLEHITKMAEVGRSIARSYGADEDLVLAGVVLHDIGKLQELAYEGGAGSYTRDGNLVGHIALGLMMVREAANGISGFPVELRSQIEHLVASHHGIREYGSPVEPKIDRGVHPRLGRRARCEAESGPQGDQRRSLRRRVHRLEQAPRASALQRQLCRRRACTLESPAIDAMLAASFVSGIPSHNAPAMMKNIDVIVNAAP